MNEETPTRERLIRLMRDSGGATLADLRGHTGLSRSTLRQHLARLAQTGIVESAPEKRPSGRPPAVYRLTSRQDALPIPPSVRAPEVRQAQSVPTARFSPSGRAPITFSFVGIPRDPALLQMAVGLRRAFESRGHRIQLVPEGDVRLIFNFIDPKRPRPFRRRGQGTFVISITVTDQPAEDVLQQAYPLLIRSLANLCIYVVRTGERLDTYFVTLEQGYYRVPDLDGEAYYDYLFQRLLPLASSELVINNQFDPDLPRGLWEGDELTRQLSDAGRRLDALDLLPTPFPIQELLPERDWRHVTRLFNLGGLSYGNLSVRKDAARFWMSASGVDKSTMQVIGRDILLVKGFDPARRVMLLSVPPQIEPRRVSVDAIEHWMIYTEHPSVGAIVHVHAWMHGVPSTTMNYPCGTRQLAKAVADLVREAPDPACAVVGLRNHGLTITGRTLGDIFDRLERGFIRQIPMS